MKNVLVIGGTGIIGKPLIFQLIGQNEYKVHSIALERVGESQFPDSVNQYVVDRRSCDFDTVIAKVLVDSEYTFDVVIDLVAYDEKDSQKLYELLKKYTKQFIILSTTLVYSREKDLQEAIIENTPLANEGMYGGYVDGKVRLEKFWNSVTDNEWTIFRTYHILGKYSLLGCAPEHNRDPEIIDKIVNGVELNLVNGGNFEFNYIHPQDIALVICKAINNIRAYKQAYNLVNPKIIRACDYYKEIGTMLKKEVRINNIEINDYLKKDKGWEMTILRHVYSTEKLEKDFDFVPSIELSEGIHDSLNNQPEYNLPINEIPVHKNMNKLPRPKLPTWLFE